MDAIRGRLLEISEIANNEPVELIEFTHNRQADLLLNNLDDYPHAFVFACIMDRQMTAERVWEIPYLLSKKIGDFRFATLMKISDEEMIDLMTRPDPLHRFPDVMAKNLYSSIQKINQDYQGNAANIWNDTPPSAALVRRFLEFEGVGPKIATMAANILVRDFKIPVSDKYSIDISADVQIRKVFIQLGLIKKDASNEEIIYKAREMNPEYPGVFDLAVWRIGRQWCDSSDKKSRCADCQMLDVCPTAT